VPKIPLPPEPILGSERDPKADKVTHLDGSRGRPRTRCSSPNSRRSASDTSESLK
jgi:hypothetical protein